MLARNSGTRSLQQRFSTIEAVLIAKRQALGYRPEQMAKRLSVEQAKYETWESGEVSIPAAVMLEVVKLRRTREGRVPYSERRYFSRRDRSIKTALEGGSSYETIAAAYYVTQEKVREIAVFYGLETKALRDAYEYSVARREKERRERQQVFQARRHRRRLLRRGVPMAILTRHGKLA